MLQDTLFIGKQKVYKQSERTIVWGGKGKRGSIIKIVKLTQEFEEMLLVTFY